MGWVKTLRIWACALLAVGLPLALCISGLLRLSAPSDVPQGAPGVLPLRVQDLLRTEAPLLCTESDGAAKAVRRLDVSEGKDSARAYHQIGGLASVTRQAVPRWTQ